DASGLDVLESFTKFLNKLVGNTYTIPISEFDRVISVIEGTSDWDPDNIDVKDIQLIQAQILSNNSIPKPQDLHIINMLSPIFPSQDPKTLVVFGERLNLDTYAGNHLVFPYATDEYKRFPNGLEIASIIFHSKRAREYLSSINDSQYQNQLNKICEEINQWPVKEKQALTWQWMDALKHLTPSLPEFNGNTSPVIPAFMKTSPWLDEKLTTVLGSWAQLKHDTILYQKHGLTWGACSTPEGYVEPYPVFYDKLTKLGMALQDSIQELDIIGFQPNENLDYAYLFTYFDKCTQALKSIAIHELEGKELTPEEKEFIKTTYRQDDMSGIVIGGWLGELMCHLYKQGASYPQEEPKSALIADIHTDLKYQTVLEVATGYFEHLIAIIPGWNGTDILAIGPVFSYYEFIISIDHRMTDDDWRGILFTRVTPSNDTYNFSAFSRGIWAQNYMVSTEMTTSVLLRPWGFNYSTPEWFGPNYNSGIFSQTFPTYFEYISEYGFHTFPPIKHLDSSTTTTSMNSQNINETNLYNQSTSGWTFLPLILFCICLTWFFKLKKRSKN
ncbi:MAG: DUF3160 domain-containing protein, partial [Candidatus Hodarchaeota archaeon]